VLDQLTTAGALVSSLEVPNSTDAGISPSSDQMVTSFSSKSEMALNLSTDDNDVTFMGYNAPVDNIDTSNANTPADIDTTNADPTTPAYRVVAQLGADGTFHFTETNAYSGNNGRAAMLNPTSNSLYTAGNAGNGANPEPQGVVLGVGAQILSAANQSESAQTPGQPTPVGNFNITELGDAADKSAKDDNFRGLTINNNVLYYTKGSGSNGVDTVYFLDTTGTACPTPAGTGLPPSSAVLPTASTLSYSTSNAALGLTTSNPGLTPTNMCILKGFPTTLAKGSPIYFPFGVWFANPTTLYVADEGSGTNTYSSTSNTYTAAASSTTAGLEKWVFDSSSGQWTLAYTLQSGLNLGVPYSPAGYPSGLNGTGAKGSGTTDLPWSPATDGLRNLTGQVNSDGTVTIWAVTSTVSGSGDQGADPNQLVSITDQLSATSLPPTESFQTVMAATNAVVIRGVSFTPGTGAAGGPTLPEAPWAPLIPLTAVAVIGVPVWWHWRRRGPHLAS